MGFMKQLRYPALKLVWGLFLVLFVVTFGYFRFWPNFRYSIDPIDPDRLTGEYDVNQEKGVWYGQEVASSPVPGSRLAGVLGHGTQPKRIEVDLTNQKVYAYEGDRRVYEFLVSTGKWGRTPAGSYRIWGKSRFQKMSGGSGSTYYYLPNVPFIMWISGPGMPASRGYSLHGTYWHNNFGHPMSHGCINMRTEDAEVLFYWSDPEVGDAKTVRADGSNTGTSVIIYGVTPDE
jgi:hypothetical protein